MSAQDQPSGIAEIEALLEQELLEVREANQRALFVSVVACILVGAYLAWATGQLSQLLDPEGLSLAATGAAVEAVPEASRAVRAAVVDGAPELAATASRGVLESLPAYRTTLEDELAPVIDEVAQVLANTAVDAMVRSADAPNPELSRQLALQEAADAVVTRLDVVLVEALDAPPEPGERSARESIEASLEQLRVIDQGLDRIVRGQGDPRERELLLGVMNLVVQGEEVADLAAKADHAAGARVEEPSR